MTNKLITSIMGVGLLATVLTGCGTEEKDEPYTSYGKVFMPSKYQKEPNFDVTPNELIRSSTPYYSELSDVNSLAKETLENKEDAKEFEKKEAERKRKEELLRQKKEQLEKQRKEELKKSQAQQTVSRGYAEETGWMNYQFTHYTAYCPEGCTGVSATGDYLGGSEYFNGYRVVAAPKNIPFYSIVRIQYPDGTEFDAIVLDRGGAIKGRLLDVLVSSESKARQLGRINGKMKVIKYGGK